MNKKIGAITIDEKGKRFKIDGDYAKGEKGGAITKLAKGSAAVMTMGMSVAAEKAVKGAVNMGKSMEWFDFKDLLDYKVRMNNQYERQGGRSSMKVFGVRISGSSGTAKKVTQSYDIVVTLNSLNHPFVTIPIMTKPLKGSAFDKAIKYGDETKFALDYILRNQ